MTAFSYSTSDKLLTRRAFYDRFSTRTQDWDMWLRQGILEHMKPGDVLDVGAGVGSVWKGFPDSAETIWLTDLSEQMLLDSVVAHDPRVDHMVCPATDLKLRSKSMDTVTAFNMLYHVPDAQRAIDEVLRVLKDDGVFILTTIGKNHLVEIRQLIEKHAPDVEAEFVALDFPLQEAAHTLIPSFQIVNQTVFPDALRIDDVQMVLDYIGTTPAGEHLSDIQLTAIEEELNRKMENGPLMVQTEVGMIVCRPNHRSGALRPMPEECPFCLEDPIRNEYWILVQKMQRSKLCLCMNQTFLGQCLLILDGIHAEHIDDLEIEDYHLLQDDLRRATKAIRAVFTPDHMNIELLGNVVPHLHYHIIPRYESDPRWTKPVWMTELRDMPRTNLDEEQYQSTISALRAELSGN